MTYVCVIGGIFIVILAICLGLFTLHNVNNMPYFIFGIKKENYEVIDQKKFNQIMIIRSTLMCILFLLAGASLIILREPEVSTFIIAFDILIDLVFAKVEKNYIHMKRS